MNRKSSPIVRWGVPGRDRAPLLRFGRAVLLAVTLSGLGAACRSGSAAESGAAPLPTPPPPLPALMPGEFGAVTPLPTSPLETPTPPPAFAGATATTAPTLPPLPSVGAVETLDPVQLKHLTERWLSAHYEQARAAYRYKKWDQTIRLCQKVLDVEPQHLKAQELMLQALEERQHQEREWLLRRNKMQHAEISTELERESILPTKRPPLDRPRERDWRAELATGNRVQMEQALNQAVSLQLNAAPLNFAIDLLCRLTGVSIIANPASLEGKQITINVHGIPLREILQYIAQTYEDITYSVGENAIWITTPGKPLLVPRAYRLNYGLLSAAPIGSGRTQINSGNNGNNGNSGGIGGTTIGQGGSLSADPTSRLEQFLTNWTQGLGDRWPAGSTWMIERGTTTLFLSTTPETHDLLAQFLEIVDQPVPQVLIKTRFVEIDDDESKAVGVDITNVISRSLVEGNLNQAVVLGGVTPDATSPTGFTASPGAATNVGANYPTAALSGPFAQFTGVGTDPAFQATLRLLEEDRRARILTAPNVLAVNNDLAIFTTGDRFSYPTDYDTITTSTVSGVDNPVVTNNVTAYVPVGFQDLEVGFALEVRPSVGRDMKTITLELHPIIDSLTGNQTVADFNNAQIIYATSTTPPVIPKPTINTTELRTKLTIEDGGYVIIGGLTRTSRETRTRRVPILGRIPLLGFFFRSQGTAVVKKHLVVIVEAQIVAPSGQLYTDKATTLPASGTREGAPGSLAPQPRSNQNGNGGARSGRPAALEGPEAELAWKTWTPEEYAGPRSAPAVPAAARAAAPALAEEPPPDDVIRTPTAVTERGREFKVVMRDEARRQ